MTNLSTHVLDAVHGRPATGVRVTLTGPEGFAPVEVRTDDDGRARVAEDLAAGDYRIAFATRAWFESRGGETFYPEVVVAFSVPSAGSPEPGESEGSGRAHLHVPLLLSPFAYSTYRGS